MNPKLLISQPQSAPSPKNVFTLFRIFINYSYTVKVIRLSLYMVRKKKSVALVTCFDIFTILIYFFIKNV